MSKKSVHCRGESINNVALKRHCTKKKKGERIDTERRFRYIRIECMLGVSTLSVVVVVTLQCVMYILFCQRVHGELLPF